jgi:NitT/TauT family transport system ATP-binding protein
MSILRIENVSFCYSPGNSIVEDIDWDIEAGSFQCLLGRSGCGKTTLLKLVAGLLAPKSGAAYLQTRLIDAPRADVSFVFQTPTLLAWSSVVDNVLLPISLHRTLRDHDQDAARYLLESLRIGAYAERFPRALSGGQQSRVAIARALITQPEVMLIDEPFAALDAITREELQADFSLLCQDRGTTVLFVTHDISEAVYLADDVAIMEGGRLHHTLPISLARLRCDMARTSTHCV